MPPRVVRDIDVWGQAMEKFGVRIYGLGAVILGLLSLISVDFAMQWQPVPKGVPGHTVLAYASGAAMMAAGVAVQLPRLSRFGAAALGLLYFTWVVLLHAPRVAAHPTNIGAWNGVAEISALAMAGLVGFALLWNNTERAAGLSRAGRLVFGLCPLVFGLAHYTYAEFTASMVPAWIPPNQLFWAYATGTCHIAAALGILSGVQARLAARLLSVMFAGFVVLLHIPRVYVDPDSRLEWTMMAIAISLTGAAWSVADSIGRRPAKAALNPAAEGLS
ncbi:DoxX family membrane protein [Phenylobacterium sp.]|uniref:DoxX family membrane protein n=1 Tax=Phenylobacterium sp. TaxID=1871053 RepID=UPI002732F8AD|nr:DoxX family membrane protein [Phenylobacterium sp.]MDP3854801.1 DoxX family membrane protein [Phenylobacterium sp.]